MVAIQHQIPASALPGALTGLNLQDMMPTHTHIGYQVGRALWDSGQGGNVFGA
jgi:hypothetical protein